MRILVCNDDGFEAPGVRLMARLAHAMTPDVWVVAPDRKWTAASHQLSFDRDLTLTRKGERAYACSGAPADCVVAAMTILFADGAKPDLVLAGVNDKRNVAEDIAYSGTMAIAREATFFGVPAIAISRGVPAPAESAELDPPASPVARIVEESRRMGRAGPLAEPQSPGRASGARRAGPRGQRQACTRVRRADEYAGAH
jgi:5'-nucleotidase